VRYSTIVKLTICYYYVWYVITIAYAVMIAFIFDSFSRSLIVRFFQQQDIFIEPGDLSTVSAQSSFNVLKKNHRRKSISEIEHQRTSRYVVYGETGAPMTTRVQ